VGLFLLNRFDQSSRSTQAPNPRYGSRVPAVARFGGSAGAGNGAGGIDVVVVVVTGGTVIAVPAPTDGNVGEAIGSGLMTSVPGSAAGGCRDGTTTPADTTAATTGVGRTRACGEVVGTSVGAGGANVVLVVGFGLVVGVVAGFFRGALTGFFTGALAGFFAIGFFTLTARVAVLIVAVLIDAVFSETVLIADDVIATLLIGVSTDVALVAVVRMLAKRRCALAGEPRRPTLARTESNPKRSIGERQLAIVGRGLSVGGMNRFRADRRSSRHPNSLFDGSVGACRADAAGCGKSGRICRPSLKGESLTPGNAFDIGQGYARDVTIR
jgi:hypothetical protein